MFKKTLLVAALAMTASLYANNNNGKETKPAQATTKETKPAQAAKSGKVQWMTDYSKAAAEAKKQNKPILLFFTGSDWCGWCKKLDSEVFQTSEFASVAGNRFVFVELDYPMNKQLPSNVVQQNADLKKKYGVTGYPTIVILDPSGNFIAETGYRPGGGKAYADYLIGLLQ